MIIFINIVNALLRISYWFYVAPMTSFASPVLLERGYTNAQIGYIMAAGSFLAIFIQSILASYADKHQEYSTIRISLWLALSVLPIFMIVFFISRVSIILSLVYVLLFSIKTAFTPFINNFTAKLAETGFKPSFALTFSVGSIGYSLASTIVGKLNKLYGTKALLISSVVGLLSFIGMLFFASKTLDKYIGKNQPVEKEKKEFVSYGQFLKKNRLYVIAIIGVLFFYFSDSVFYNFTLQIVNNVGGDSEAMGLVLSIASMSQIPGFLVFPFIKKKSKYSTLLIFGAVMYAVRAAVIYSATSVTLLYVSGLVRMLNYPFFTSSIIPFVNEMMPKAEANRGQTLFTIASSVSSILASFTGGRIIDAYGASAMLLIATILAVVGVIIFIPAIIKTEKAHEGQLA